MIGNKFLSDMIGTSYRYIKISVFCMYLNLSSYQADKPASKDGLTKVCTGTHIFYRLYCGMEKPDREDLFVMNKRETSGHER